MELKYKPSQILETESFYVERKKIPFLKRMSLYNDLKSWLASADGSDSSKASTFPWSPLGGESRDPYIDSHESIFRKILVIWRLTLFGKSISLVR